jgi:hypothetical protein
LEERISKALKDKGFDKVIVDSSTIPMTLRGSVPRRRMTQAVQAALEAGGKPFRNELNER